MTLTGEEIGTPVAPEPRPRRNMRRYMAGAVAVAVAIVVGAAWAVAAATTVGRVSVVYDAEPVRCEGTEVGAFSPSDDEDFVYTGVSLTPGMHCELRIHVINDGWRDIRVSSVGLPQFGGDGPLKLEPLVVNPNGQERIAGNSDLNEARFGITGFAVAAQSTQLFTALFTYSGGATFSECSAMLVPPAQVAFSALGASRTDAPPEHSSVWFVQGPLNQCQPG